MLVKQETTQIGDILRYWRRIRRLSQMELAAAANISTRHLSFVETGRSRPRRNVVLRLANALHLPFRHANALLESAGFSTNYSNIPLSDERMTPVRQALQRLLSQHEPLPALVVNHVYDILLSNQGFRNLSAWLAGEEVLRRYSNIYRLVFATDGLQPYFQDWPIVRHALLVRLHEEAVMRQDDRLWQLYADCAGQGTGGVKQETIQQEVITAPVLDFALRKDKVTLRFFSAITTFGTAADVTVQELHIESMFPVDAFTREWFAGLNP